MTFWAREKHRSFEERLGSSILDAEQKRLALPCRKVKHILFGHWGAIDLTHHGGKNGKFITNIIDILGGE
ncbi:MULTISPECIES: hypothetical protein [Methanothrix]|uniref:Uncharacterized protein n=1 Tax=hydrocarbon metagenome TaxID=938273 RepID=A0A0W8F6K6_9ZZZZ|nr:hypothetical protein [Methanothrix soehngenii]